MTDTQTIKDRIDIVQLIGEYVPLKRAGANWKGNCPFHQEKSPSFMAHPEKQIWHCFGCSKGGDIFTFIQEIEGLDFPEALKLLADRAGVKLERANFNEGAKDARTRVAAVTAAAAYFFHHFLLEVPGAKIARDYLATRGVSGDSIHDWQIGYAPDQWDLLTKYLLKKNYALDDIVAAGLAVKKDGAPVGRGCYDRFRGRIMFPIKDVHGNIVGFTGRIIVETEHSGGKYVNTPETVLYNKSRVLYGLERAKLEIKAKSLAVIVEGQMDVVACHAAGMKNVVAASGTALTFEQVKLLKRYADTVAMAFDADAAGQNAARRGVAVAIEEGLRVNVIVLPEGAGKDADECLKKNPAVWFEAVVKAVPVMEWLFQCAHIGEARNDPAKKQRVADALLPEIARIPFPVERDDWLKRLASELAVDPEVLRAEVKNHRPVTQNKSADSTLPPLPVKNKVIPGDRRLVLARELWSIFAVLPQLVPQFVPHLNPAFFAHTDYAPLYDFVVAEYNHNNTFTFDVNQVPREYVAHLASFIAAGAQEFEALTLDSATKEIENIILQLASIFKKQGREELEQELRIAEAAKNNERAAEILQILAKFS